MKDLLSDLNIARKCEENCAYDMLDCIQECGASTECTSSCYRGNVVCIDACPCHAGKYQYHLKNESRKYRKMFFLVFFRLPVGL